MARRFPCLILVVPVLAVLCLGDALVLHRRPLPVMPCDMSCRFAARPGALVSFNEGKWVGLLHQSAAQGRLALIRFFLEHGHSVDERDGNGRAPLHWAAATGELAAVTYLVGHGANMNARCDNGSTPLHGATLNDHPAVLGFLIDHGADPGARTSRDETPLHLAAERGNLSAARLLLSRGAEVDARDRKGVTPLHLAAEGSLSDPIEDQRYPAVVSLLIASGADTNVRDLEGRTPLYRASAAGCPKTVELLLTAGADPSIGDEGGRTPLHAVASLGEDAAPLEVAVNLVEHGARVDAVDRSSIQPAQLAASSGDMSLVLFFMRCGAREPDCPYRKTVFPGHYICTRMLAVQVYSMLVLLVTLGVYRHLPVGCTLLARLCLTAGMASSAAVPILLERLMPTDLFCLYAQALPAGIAACLMVYRLGQAIRHRFPVSVHALLFALAGGVIFPFAAVFFTFSGILPASIWSSLAIGTIGGACLVLCEQVVSEQASGKNVAEIPALFAPARNEPLKLTVRDLFR